MGRKSHLGPFVVQKIIPNESFIVRRLNTNKTQLLRRIQLKKFVPTQPLEDSYREKKLQPDEEIIILQDEPEYNYVGNKVRWTVREQLFRLTCQMANSRSRQTTNQITQTNTKLIT